MIVLELYKRAINQQKNDSNKVYSLHYRASENRFFVWNKTTFWAKKEYKSMLMAATAWNLKKMMEKLKENILYFICRLLFPQNSYYLVV
jgi:hypothetical protein